VVWAIDPNIVISEIDTMDERVADPWTRPVLTGRPASVQTGTTPMNVAEGTRILVVDDEPGVLRLLD
jgi:hypothetical protein